MIISVFLPAVNMMNKSNIHFIFLPTVKVNENATFVEDGMDDDIEFDDYSEEEEDVVADIDAVSNIM